jgi:hypothetical protein
VSDNTRYRWEKAVAKVHTLRGELASAERQLQTTTNAQTAKTKTLLIPSIQRRLDEAQAELVECERLKGEGYKVATSQYFKLNFRTDIMSDEEANTLTIPDFLRRTS